MVMSSSDAIFEVDMLTTSFIFNPSRLSRINPDLFWPISLYNPGFPDTEIIPRKFILQ